jgi:hypothetical protein
MISKFFASMFTTAALVATSGLLVAAEEPQAVEPETAAVEEAVEEEAPQLVLAVPQAPRSLQTVVDERREALRGQRERHFELITPEYFHSPGMAAYRDLMDDYGRAIRALHRQQRDAMKALHDSRRRIFSPYSAALQDWSEARNYAVQMAQLDRQEAFENFVETHPFGAFGYGPFGYPW